MSIVKLASARLCRAEADKDPSILKAASELENDGTEYILSDLKGRESEVVTGDNAGALLSAFLSFEGDQVLGTDARGAQKLPLSIKISQGQEGLVRYSADKKHEAIWYVLSAPENAKIYFGVRNSTSAQQLEQGLKEETWKELLQPVEAAKGDLFQVDAGTVYAFDPGIEVLEIQEETTDENGKTQVEEVPAAFEPVDHDAHHTDWLVDGQGDHAMAGRTEVFELDLFRLDGRLELDADEHSFKAIVLLEGDLVVEKEDEDLILHGSPKDCFFVEANTAPFHLTGNATFALVHLTH